MTNDKPTDTQPRSIRLDPDYKRLYAAFARDAENYAEALAKRLGHGVPAQKHLDNLRTVQGMMASLNICAHSTDTIEAVHQFRELMDRCTQTIVKQADIVQSLLDNIEDEDPTDGKGLL